MQSPIVPLCACRCVLSDSPEEAGFAPAEDGAIRLSADSSAAAASPTSRDHPLATASFLTAVCSFARQGRVWLSLLACIAYTCESAIVATSQLVWRHADEPHLSHSWQEKGVDIYRMKAPIAC